MTSIVYRLEQGDVSVGILTLDDGKLNSFNFDTIRDFNAVLDEAAKDDGKALVIVGNSKALSAGFDLKIMSSAFSGSPDDALNLVEQGGRLMMKLSGFPKPVVIAASGHSLALGAILLLTGDVRLAQKGSKVKIGMNETAIGMVLPEFGWRLGQHRLKNAEFTRAVTQATVYDVAGAASVGYVDELVGGDVLTAAVAEAKRLGGYVKQPAFAKMKMAERGELINGVLSRIKANVRECMLQSKL